MYTIITADDCRAAEAAFAADTRSLFQDVPPAKCDCSQCPTRELCKALCDYWQAHDLL